MTDLIWLELFPPRGLDLAAMTNLMRTVANRPVRGVLRRTPVLAFEVWSHGSQVRWLLGLEPPLATSVPAQFQAQLPGLGISRRAVPARPMLLRASEVRLSGLSFPLRLDTVEAVSAGVLAALTGISKRESAVMQWAVGP